MYNWDISFLDTFSMTLYFYQLAPFDDGLSSYLEQHSIDKHDAFFDLDPTESNRPQFNLLLDRLSDNDVLIIPSLEKLGSSISDVSNNLLSLSICNVRIQFIDKSDQSLLDKFDGTIGLANHLLEFLQIERRISASRRKAGIESAKLNDSKLSPWEFDKRKYKGRKPLSRKKRKLILHHLLMKRSIVSIARDLGISRGTVYNYQESVFDEYSDEVFIARNIMANKNFEILPSTKYETLNELLLDLYYYHNNLCKREIMNSIKAYRHLMTDELDLLTFSGLLVSGLYDYNNQYHYSNESKSMINALASKALEHEITSCAGFFKHFNQLYSTQTQLIDSRTIRRIKTLDPMVSGVEKQPFTACLNSLGFSEIDTVKKEIYYDNLNMIILGANVSHYDLNATLDNLYDE